MGQEVGRKDFARTLGVFPLPPEVRVEEFVVW
jgi:hypothetical protein